MPTPDAQLVETRDVLLGEDWLVGSPATGAIFGGLLAAEVIRAGRQALDAPTAVPLSLSISYHRPVQPGSTDVAVTVVRRGTRIATVAVDIGASAATAQVVFGLAARPESLPFRNPGHLPSPAQPAAGDLSALVDWRAYPDPWGAAAGEPHTAWIRPREGWRTEEGALDPAWFAVAADLIGPALFAGEAFRVATVSLDLRVHATTESEWLQQNVTARRTGDLAVASVELSDPAGVVVATASQTAILLPAGPGELPASVTAFGWGIPNSSIYAQMIGLN